jgi:hypothetical protein
VKNGWREVALTTAPTGSRATIDAACIIAQSRVRTCSMRRSADQRDRARRDVLDRRRRPVTARRRNGGSIDRRSSRSPERPAGPLARLPDLSTAAEHRQRSHGIGSTSTTSPCRPTLQTNRRCLTFH